MAERRMFSKSIIDSDAFLDMTQTAQLLYFHLSMRADDDGFINNPKAIMRNVRCSEEDLRLLANKKFIIPFETGVVVIKHWKIHNYIRNDRYKETKYKEEKEKLLLDENNSYTTGIPNDNQMDTVGIPVVSKMDTQVRLGKDSIDNNNITSNIMLPDGNVDSAKSTQTTINYSEIAELYNSICVSFPRLKTLSENRKKAIKARLNKFTLEDFKTVFINAENSDFLKGANNRNWSANFDWLIKDANFTKVLEGNYANTTKKASTTNKFHNFEQRHTDYNKLVANYYGFNTGGST